MNVWIVNPFDNLPMEGNRPQRYWLMSRAFARAGHRVTLWTSDFSHATKAKRILKENVDGGFEVVMIPTLPYPTNVCLARVRSHRRLARDFESVAKRRTSDAAPDLVVSSVPPLCLCAAAMRVAKRCGARFVCDVQDAWPETFERLLPRRFGWAGRILFAPMRSVVRRIYREADAVSGVCRRYAELSGRDDFHLSYHGIEGGNAAPITRRPNAATALVYVGNLGEGYDLDTVIEAVAKRPDLTLDVAGLGPTEKTLKRKAEELRLGGRVRFHGYLGRDDLRALMARCGIGVVPMRDDSWVGLPYKLLDYFAAGLQVASSLHGECGTWLEKTGFGRTYDWGSPDSLLAALDSLPRVDVALPDELRAERIYPKYVEWLEDVVRGKAEGETRRDNFPRRSVRH